MEVGGSMMKRSIDTYRNIPGEHCGSIAMKNLLYHYCGLDIPEEAVFGLGSGIDCFYLESDTLDPPVVVFGRNVTMEADLAHALGVDYRETIEMDEARAWEVVRREVDEGRPTMLSGDIFYLDYRDYKVHFPAHRFVLVGYDDEQQKAFVADRLDPEPQACSYGAVATSRNPPVGLSTHNLWGKFHDTEIRHSLEEACSTALRRSADRMLGRDTSQADLMQASAGGQGLRLTTGLEGIAQFSREVVRWQERDRVDFIASYVSKSLEKFGTGGGNFRKMYATFLAWSRERWPDLVPEKAPALADRAAGCWTQVAATLADASKEPGQRRRWKQVSREVDEIHSIESELFESINATVRFD